MKKLRTLWNAARRSDPEAGHAAAWGGSGLLTIVVIVVLLVLLF